MWSRSHRVADGPDEALLSPTRRRHHRQKLRSLAYAKLDSDNGGILLDICESGMAAQVLSPLRPDQAVRLRVDLADPRLHLEAEGRVAWTNSAGRAGIELLEFSPRSGRMLKEWLFTQMLA